MLTTFVTSAAKIIHPFSGTILPLDSRNLLKIEPVAAPTPFLSNLFPNEKTHALALRHDDRASRERCSSGLRVAVPGWRQVLLYLLNSVPKLSRKERILLCVVTSFPPFDTSRARDREGGREGGFFLPPSSPSFQALIVPYIVPDTGSCARHKSYIRLRGGGGGGEETEDFPRRRRLYLFVDRGVNVKGRAEKKNEALFIHHPVVNFDESSQLPYSSLSEEGRV